jgi:hypothetical protein
VRSQEHGRYVSGDPDQVFPLHTPERKKLGQTQPSRHHQRTYAQKKSKKINARRIFANCWGSSANSSLGGSNAGDVDAYVAKYFDGPPGDYNRDYSVDAADYTMWRDNIGNLVEPCSGADANCNGFVENSEYFIWRDHFGESTITGAGSNQFALSVPEPTTAWMVFLMLVGIAGTLRWNTLVR